LELVELFNQSGLRLTAETSCICACSYTITLAISKKNVSDCTCTSQRMFRAEKLFVNKI